MKYKITKYQNPPGPINTTSEFILDPKTMKSVRNPNAKMGLEIVSPEFQLLTAGVGSLGTKAVSTAGKIGQTMLHGAGQGAMANMSNLSGSAQSASGLAQDVIGGAVVGGMLKGIGLGAKPMGKYALQKAEPYLLGEKSIPMSGYKPKMNIIETGVENDIAAKTTSGFRPRNPLSMVTDVIWDGFIPRLHNSNLPKGGYFRKIGNNEGLTDLIEQKIVRQPIHPNDGGFSGTPGTYFSENFPIEDYKGRFLVHHPGEGNRVKNYFGGDIGDAKFRIPDDKKYPLSVTPVELSDPKTTLYKRRFMSTQYDKLDKNNLMKSMKNVDKYNSLENTIRNTIRLVGTEETARNGFNWWMGKNKQDIQSKKQGGKLISRNKK